jgi:hypothetical protein
MRGGDGKEIALVTPSTRNRKKRQIDNDLDLDPSCALLSQVPHPTSPQAQVEITEQHEADFPPEKELDLMEGLVDPVSGYKFEKSFISTSTVVTWITDMY